MRICDKCELPVKIHEDATWLTSIATKSPAYILLASPRHIRCSPSRAQYITAPEFGEPVIDNREYDKRLKSNADRTILEAHFTAAWYELQKED